MGFVNKAKQQIKGLFKKAAKEQPGEAPKTLTLIVPANPITRWKNAKKILKFKK